ncbi:MAG: hypothetical protein KBA95_02695 [Acidobacteria bacterium]|nr:hypothetical protein [Acidobacteriota bacterium]
MNITAPKPVTPGTGAEVEANRQPITLVIENASTTGVRPLTYSFEIALDGNFGNKVLSRAGIAPGQGRTSLRLPEALAADRKYYWRARAEDGANTGPFSAAAAFTVFTPITLEAPALVSPANGERLTSRTPTFVITNARRSGPAGPVTYALELAKDKAFGSVVARVQIPEKLPDTRNTLKNQLAYNTRYYWRVRATEATRDTAGPWSSTWSFVTVEDTSTPEEPPFTPPPGGKVPSNYRTGKDVIAYVSRAYPERLVATGPMGSSTALAKRQANMTFLRDRIIEVGICGGMDLGWNKKRGTGPFSIDALAWRHGSTEVIDVGKAYDGTDQPLELIWLSVGGTPGYTTYTPRPNCQ